MKPPVSNTQMLENPAMLTPTSRSYISRIENDESGIEIHTLEKIVAYGLRKKLDIKIKS